MVKTLIRAAALLLLLPALAACELGADQFPKYLNYAVGKVDLDSLFAAEGLLDPVYVSRVLMTPDSGPGGRRALIYASSYEGSRLFVLDGTTLKPLKILSDSSLRSFLAIAPSGNYLCGGVELDAATLAVVSSARATASLPESARAFTDGSYLYAFYCDASGLQYVVYDSAIAVSGSGAALVFSDVAASSTQLLDVRYDASSTTALRFLFSTYSGGRSLSFATLADFSAAGATPPLDTSGATTTFSGFSDNSAWATADGIVALSYGQYSRLVRYSWSSGSELDSERLPNSSGDRRYYFEPSGAYRLYYDEGAGLLHLLRTWWK